LAKIIASSQHKGWGKTLARFYIEKLKKQRLGLESARATLWKLATCTRQTFLLGKQAETIRN